MKTRRILILIVIACAVRPALARTNTDGSRIISEEYRSTPEQLERWSRPVEPFHIAGSLYYVGSHEVTSFLMTTDEGHILLDGGLPETASMIADNIRRLGFELTDVKILLNSHAHSDHAGGLALLKKMTGARLAAMDADVAALESGVSDFGRFPPVKVDVVLRHRDEIILGDTKLTAHLTPGHTAGCTTWSTTIRGSDRTLDAVFVGSPNALPEHDLLPIADQFVETFRRLRSLPADLFFASHGSFFNLGEKIGRLTDEPAERVFQDQEGYKAFVERKERQFRQELERQRRESAQ